MEFVGITHISLHLWSFDSLNHTLTTEITSMHKLCQISLFFLSYVKAAEANSSLVITNCLSLLIKLFITMTLPLCARGILDCPINFSLSIKTDRVRKKERERELYTKNTSKKKLIFFLFMR